MSWGNNGTNSQTSFGLICGKRIGVPYSLNGGCGMRMTRIWSRFCGFFYIFELALCFLNSASTHFSSPRPFRISRSLYQKTISRPWWSQIILVLTSRLKSRNMLATWVIEPKSSPLHLIKWIYASSPRPRTTQFQT